MNAQTKHPQLKHYFHPLRLKGPGIALGACALIYYTVSSSQYPVIHQLALMAGVVSLGLIIYRLISYYTAPPDAAIDTWLEEDIEKLVTGAYQQLGIKKSERPTAPLLIIAPVYWKVKGVEMKDLGLRKGKDKMLRFSVYQVTLFHLDEDILTSYTCHYNFLQGIVLNETTHEYHDKDIVSVAMKDVSVNYHLPDGQQLIAAQEFQMSVTSGESIRLLVSPNTLAQREKATLPPTGAEKAVSVIRNILRAKKV